jgi:hypothetical protein
MNFGNATKFDSKSGQTAAFAQEKPHFAAQKMRY